MGPNQKLPGKQNGRTPPPNSEIRRKINLNNPEVTQVSADKELKTLVLLSVFHMYKKRTRDIEDIQTPKSNL